MTSDKPTEPTNDAPDAAMATDQPPSKPQSRAASRDSSLSSLTDTDNEGDTNSSPDSLATMVEIPTDGSKEFISYLPTAILHNPTTSDCDICQTTLNHSNELQLYDKEFKRALQFAHVAQEMREFNNIQDLRGYLAREEHTGDTAL
ncbi:hypothetical protein EIP91_010758, partial [Steccherinum ochraceum]